MKSVLLIFLAAFAIFFLTSPAWSQTTEKTTGKGFGLRAGYGTNPDQFVIGTQAILGKTLGFMRFAPSFDVGFGDKMTTYLVNADFHLLSFAPPGSPAGLYFGAGASIAVLDVNKDGSDTEIGLNVVTGLTFPMGRKNDYNMEVRFGFADMPDLRILFGVLLGSRSKPVSSTIEIRR
ncbi:MAG: hypothetical protein CVT49_12995 [candidate division Zixibacteria bacterium HGW-Zixibacteria-1]|nr:MAG: hypothetical protein CVT49_12995 [candidate division Zixibacteria bacterium HGW-Zixibacteria-1]